MSCWNNLSRIVECATPAIGSSKKKLGVIDSHKSGLKSRDVKLNNVWCQRCDSFECSLGQSAGGGRSRLALLIHGGTRYDSSAVAAVKQLNKVEMSSLVEMIAER
jgi:hypothetical protein